MSVKKSKRDVRTLILAVRDGDQNAFDTLLDQYRPLIDASVARFSTDETFSLYCEDLKQEASVVFYNSILAYDLEQNEVEFGLFAKICIYNALVSFLRAMKRRSAEPVAEIPQNLSTVWVVVILPFRILKTLRQECWSRNASNHFTPS